MTSYGGLIPGQSVADFFSCSSMPRNRELMRVFKDVGLVEQLGSGMSRILKAYPKDIFEISEHFIKVVFPIENAQEMPAIANGDINGDINGDAEKVFKLLSEKPGITAKEMEIVLGFSGRKISRIMKELNSRIESSTKADKGNWCQEVCGAEKRMERSNLCFGSAG